ncbi:hypothetical protein PV08_10088 [Exophiala spinifera]|uniref:DUF159 domain protein n=1 Tax=Exophiala spinifera TaxID=91928 RepID=A0A0D2BHF0_9EURO|nr:uncharacterized protein PV08_10088 [Exophiala spinifera]KIW10789.1 hypothetical protein PV08_10088 [Exophiala spinifera]
MCGRYALGIRAAFVRYHLQQQGLPVDDAPADDEVRETYNFPPGAYGLVYRAEVPDHGIGDGAVDAEALSNDATAADTTTADTTTTAVDTSASSTTSDASPHYKYELKAMKWGLVPFWTKRSPEYSSLLRTINCRDDSLIENRGMWTTMKQRKRCIVIAQGFYEWLKKGPGPKDKVPHFVKRKDGNLMCFAGLWDCVKYEEQQQQDSHRQGEREGEREREREKLYTYTIITTDSNKQLSFLHDRMPVILDPGTDAMKMWLDPTRTKWSRELQSVLKPYDGELLCYPVDSAVGKVGNNSPNFIVPVDSKDNKKNIANFFGNANKPKPKPQSQLEKEEADEPQSTNITTVDQDGSETKAPMPVPVPVPAPSDSLAFSPGEKRHRPDHDDSSSPAKKHAKVAPPPVKSTSPVKSTAKKPRSATSNREMTLKKTSPAKKTETGTQRITNFFTK